MTEREIRGGIPAEIRADEEGGIRVSGHAAVFNERADIAGLFEEVIEPGAFRDAIGPRVPVRRFGGHDASLRGH